MEMISFHIKLSQFNDEHLFFKKKKTLLFLTVLRVTGLQLLYLIFVTYWAALQWTKALSVFSTINWIVMKCAVVADKDAFP